MRKAGLESLTVTGQFECKRDKVKHGIMRLITTKDKKFWRDILAYILKIHDTLKMKTNPRNSLVSGVIFTMFRLSYSLVFFSFFSYSITTNRSLYSIHGSLLLSPHFPCFSTHTYQSVNIHQSYAN